MACAVGEVANKVEDKKWYNPIKFFRNIGLASIEGGKHALKYGYDATRDMDFRQNVLPSLYDGNYEEALNKFIKDHPGFTTPEDLKRYVEDVLKIPGFVYRVINLSIQQADEQINENHSHVSHGCVWTCV